jgi:hypothetical protein
MIIKNEIPDEQSKKYYKIIIFKFFGQTFLVLMNKIIFTALDLLQKEVIMQNIAS